MRKPFSPFLLMLVFCLSNYQLQAQSNSSKNSSHPITGVDLIRISDQRKTVDYVRLNSSASINQQEVAGWLLTTVFKVGSDYSLVPIKSETDKIGFKHIRFAEYYSGIPVERGIYITHFRNEQLVSVNGEFYDRISVQTTPTISKENAFQKALEQISAIRYRNDNLINLATSEQSGTIVIFPKNNTFYLAYKFDIYAEQPLKRENIYVDAHSGKVLFEENTICTFNTTATAVTGFSGAQTITTDSLSPTNYRLNETARGNGINTLNLNNGTNYATATDFTDVDNYWNTTTIDQYAYDAHFGAEKTYDFYYNNYGRNSYDNAGAAINSYVHYSTGFVNAFWDGTEMTYGDGDGTQYYPLTSLEIVGHEITHAVTEHTAGLIYSGESGALNESFSDIFGMTIRFNYTPLTATWFCGDQILVPGGGGIPFRNMSDPNQFQCADTYGGTYWNYGDIVHYDSGVQNYWYYLLTIGATGVNDLGNPFTVNGIGLTDASAIAYRNLSVYLTPSSTFADARFYAIQSAIDLFGSCSNQVIQTTNAWYAVGVGGLFSNAVVSSFTAPNNFYCTLPATVNFINNSINASSYFWDFGDGDSSLLASPSHTYLSAGNFTVTLISYGVALCGNSDTLVKTNYINVTNGGGPVSAACTPATTSFCCDVGIKNLQFGGINYTSLNASEGYKDFTCNASATITAGDPVPIDITTSLSTFENVSAYIDYDNNGIFDPITELVFTSLNKLHNHSGIVHTSLNAVLNTPLRMRVMDDNTTFPIVNSCANLHNGQAEDYTLVFVANTQPPVADFTVSATVINVGSSVNFSDLSIHAPTSWQWTFSGGTPSTSTLQNPVVTYNTLGDYDVTLVVSNSFGSDSVVKTAYIHVVNSVNMCSGTTVITANNGQLYDSGGPTGNYLDNESCSLLISPGCVAGITLSFTQFSSESGYDYFRVYDGPNATAPLILTANGSIIPAPVTANSGQMFITWYSDVSVVSSGWSAEWVSGTSATIPPVAEFGASDTNPPLASSVQFTDQTTNQPLKWTWDFGDGNSSTIQNPSHSYLTSGQKTVTLIADNCIDKDTVTHSIDVQLPPSISVNPDSINVNIGCGDSITLPLYIYNTSGGALNFNILGHGLNDSVRVLAMLYGVDYSGEYFELTNGINQYFTKYSLDTSMTTSSTELQSLLVDYDVLLFPEQESGNALNNTLFAPVIQNFVSNGGTVIVCGSNYSNTSTKIYDFGLFTGNYINYVTSGTLAVTDTTDDLADGISLTFPAINSTFYHNITNTDKTKLVTYNAYDVVSYRNIGLGKAIYLGFDYYAPNTQTNILAANAIKYSTSGLPPWIIVDTTSGGIVAGDSMLINVTISSFGYIAGTYNGYIILSSNDPLHPFDTIPVSMTVSGTAEIAMSDTCFDFGSISQYTSSTDTLKITNSGCDTLHITSTSISNGAFNVTPANIDIAPYQTINFLVSFNPQTVGTFNGTLTIYNSVHDTTICLNGTSTLAPQIAFNPDSINVNIGCGDSITVPLWVYNNGGGILNFDINGSGNNNDSVKVLAMLYGVDFAGEYYELINGIDQYFTKYSIDTTLTTSPTELQSLLSNKDVILFPEQEYGMDLNNMSFAPVIQNFIANGGTVIVCGSTYSLTTNKIYDLGLFTGNYMNYITTGTLNVSDTTDDLTDGIPLSFPVINLTTYHNITNADKTELVSYNNNDVVTYRNIGTGKAIFLGFDYYAPNAETNLLAANAIKYSNGGLPQWILPDTTSGEISAGDSMLINVTINAFGYTAGTYNGYLIINSNDPLHPVDSIPVSMTVSGSAEIAISDTCFDFGTITQYTVSTDTLKLTNSGCDTLHITSTSISNSAFNVVPSSINIPPYQTGSLLVNFNPQTVGSFSGTLTLFNNAHDTTICLNGASTLAPKIQFNPDSIYTTLGCDASATVPLYVYNTGGGILDFNIKGEGNNDSIKVLAMLYGVDYLGEYTQLINGIDQYFTKYSIDTTFTISPTELQSLLINKDVLLYPEQESGNSLTNTIFAPVIQNFVTNGGTVIICGSEYGNAENKIYDFGLFTGNYMNYTSTGTLTVSDTTDDITDGLPLNFPAVNLSFYHNITNADKTELVSYSNYDVVTYRNIGSGKAIFLGFDYYSTSAQTSRLAANCIKYAEVGLPPWILIDTTSGNIVAGDSMLLNVTINSAGLAPGTYSIYIIFNSNDPLHPIDSVPVTLIVTGNPCADFTFNAIGCSGLVNFSDLSANSPTTWKWYFGDGDSSMVKNPVHQYLASGNYNVMLIATNAYGPDTIYISVPVNYLDGSFTVSGSLFSGQSLLFTPTTTNALTYSWHFGDGDSSALQNPSHVYLATGTYIVTLVISSPPCTVTVIDTLVISTVGINEAEEFQSILLAPNPFTDELIITYNLSGEKNVSIEVVDIVGQTLERIIWGQKQKPGKYSFTVRQNSAGYYVLKITIDNAVKSYRILKLK